MQYCSRGGAVPQAVAHCDSPSFTARQRLCTVTTMQTTCVTKREGDCAPAPRARWTRRGYYSRRCGRRAAPAMWACPSCTMRARMVRAGLVVLFAFPSPLRRSAVCSLLWSPRVVGCLSSKGAYKNARVCNCVSLCSLHESLHANCQAEKRYPAWPAM
jgi:hypothetical protein